MIDTQWLHNKEWVNDLVEDQYHYADMVQVNQYNFDCLIRMAKKGNLYDEALEGFLKQSEYFVGPSAVGSFISELKHIASEIPEEKQNEN